jgi:hypothetical protein
VNTEMTSDSNNVILDDGDESVRSMVEKGICMSKPMIQVHFVDIYTK